VGNQQLQHKPLKTLDEALERIAVEPANYGSKLCSNARKIQGFLPLVEKMSGMPELLEKLIEDLSHSSAMGGKNEKSG
jgi:hypothetical protein